MNVKKKTPWAMPRFKYMLVESVSRKAPLERLPAAN
jgi:hypothetical protein